MSIVCGPKWLYYSCDWIYWIYWIYCTVWDRYMQVLYLGRAPYTKETLPDFREKCRVTRHSRVFRGLTGSQRTPGFGASHIPSTLSALQNLKKLAASVKTCATTSKTLAVAHTTWHNGWFGCWFRLGAPGSQQFH